MRDKKFNSKIGYWADLDIENCPCRGTGWALLADNIWNKCPVHFNNQPQPDSLEAQDDSIDVIFDDRTLEDEISNTKELVEDLRDLLKNAQKKLIELELQLVNCTPTVKMPVAPEVMFDEGWSTPEIDIQDKNNN